MQIMSRPKLDKEISINDFKDYYWLKEELVGFCRAIGINRSGGKIAIYNRIITFLENGEIIFKPDTLKANTCSTFDWNIERLGVETLITDNYKNTQNVRAFFQNKIGNHFKFNVAFINWMKANQGKTLGDAIDKWIDIAEQKKDKNHKTVIAPQFEYNTYIRAFLNDNPHLSSKDAMRSWMIKREKPGVHKYEEEDLRSITTYKK